MLPQFLSEIPRLAMVGKSSLKLFLAAMMHALGASTQPPDSPITSPRYWKVYTAFNMSSSICTWVEFKLSGGALLPLHFLHLLSMCSFFSVPLTPRHLLWIQKLQLWQSIEFTPTPLEHTTGPFNICFWLWASPDEPGISVLPTYILRTECLEMFSKPVTGSLNLLNYHSWQDHLHVGAPKSNQYNTHERAEGLKRNNSLPLLLCLHHRI